MVSDQIIDIDVVTKGITICYSIASLVEIKNVVVLMLRSMMIAIGLGDEVWREIIICNGDKVIGG